MPPADSVRRSRRFEILLFALAWISFAYFHQGGGWNQNGRFALTRALVESRRPWIDDFLVYVPRPGAVAPTLTRVPVRHGVVLVDGRGFALGWYAGDGPLEPLDPETPPGAGLVSVDSIAVTGDLAYARGHVHPNKAPGASLAAVPGYALLWTLERAAGIDPDGARVLAVNAWLTGVLSVGWIAALGVVAFYRLARRLIPGPSGAALFATIAFAFGSLYFPYATMLYEHDLAAAALVGAMLFAYERRAAIAGLCAGAAIVASYLSLAGAAILGVYVLLRDRRRGGAAFALGMLPPLAVLGAYNLACFGRVLTTNYAWQNPLFRDAHGSVLDVFAAPDPSILVKLLVSPERGLFVLTPVLVLGVVGLATMLRTPKLRVEALVCVAMVAHVLAFNVTFNAWHGGWACGPRYLIPAVPFLALPIAFVTRWAPLRYLLLTVSIAAMVIATAVDAQPAWVEAHPSSPVWTTDLTHLLGDDPVSVNTGSVFEAMGGRLENWNPGQASRNSFNAGELLGLRGRWSLIPWLAVAGCLVWGMIRKRPSKHPF